MIITALIYIVYVFPLGLKNYLKKSEIPLLVKVIHLILTFILFQYYFEDFRIKLWDVFKEGIAAFYMTNEHISFSREFDLITSVLYFLLAIYMAGLMLNLAAKVKSKKLFLFTTPLIAIITSLDLVKYIFNEYQLDESILYSFFIAFLIVLIILGLVNLFYSIKPGNKLFKIPEGDQY